MAAYPSVAQAINSVMEVDDGTRVSRTPSGKPVFRNWFTAERRVFRVTHHCGNTDKESIRTHYEGDWMNGFSFTYAGTGQAYTVRYAAPPKFTPAEGNYRWTVEVILVEQ